MGGGGWLHLTLTGCQAPVDCLHPPLNDHHPRTSFSRPFPDPLYFSSPLSSTAIVSSACGCVLLDVVTCVRWHILTRRFSKSMKLNRGAPVSWIFSGWPPTMPLCLVSAHADLMNTISRALSVLHAELEAHRAAENSHPASALLNLFLKAGKTGSRGQSGLLGTGMGRFG